MANVNQSAAVPAQLTLTDGPWSGSYADRRWNSGDQTWSYYCSSPPSGRIKVGAWGPEVALPRLHITVDPANPTVRIHFSFEFEGRNAHLHYNGGSLNWDAALDQAKLAVVNAIHQAYGPQLSAWLHEISGQVQTGVIPQAPARTQQTGTPAAVPANDNENFPPLPSQQRPAVTVAAASADARQAPQQAEDLSYFSTTPEAFLSGEAPAVTYGGAQPTGGQEYSLFGTPPAQPALTLARATDEGYVFENPGGGTLSIDRTTFDEAVAGKTDLPASDTWYPVTTFMGETVMLPAVLFEHGD